MWLSKAPGDDVATYDGSGYWFKVYELGLSLDRNATSQYYRVHWDSLNASNVR